MQFGVSTSRSFDGISIKQPTQNDWRASFTEHPGTFRNHKATAFDDQAITVQYFQGSAVMNAFLVPGSPYMTFEYKGATPLLTSRNGGIRSFNGQTLAVGASGTLIIFYSRPMILGSTRVNGPDNCRSYSNRNSVYRHRHE